MLRRDVLAGLLALAAKPAFAGGEGEPGLQLEAGTAFEPDTVAQIAKRLSQSAYVPAARVPEAWTSLSYDQYNAMRRTRPSAAL